METLRLFLSIRTPDAVRSELSRSQQQLAEAYEEALRLTPPEQLHLTVKFLGSVARGALPPLEESLSSACSGLPPLSLSIGATGSFPERGPARIFWVGWTGEGLRELQQRVESALAPLGFAPEVRPFVPHITLARARTSMPAEARKFWSACVLPPVPSSVAALELMQSILEPSGARHETIASFSFNERHHD